MKLSKVLIFFLLFFIVISSSVYYFYVNPNLLYILSGKKDFNELIEEIDSHFKTNKLNDAKIAINLASSYSDTEFKWLSLFKRSKNYAFRANDFSLMKEIAVKSTKSLPGNLKLRSLEVYSLIKIGDINSAYNIANDYLKGQDKYKLIYEEAFMRHLSYGSNILSLKEFLTKLDNEKDPLTFEKIGLDLKNNAFLINAMLLYINKSDFNSARRILSYIKEDKDFARELAYISYDLDNLDFVISNLKLINKDNEPALMFLLADAYFRKGNIRNAKNEYFKLYTNFPDYNFIVYLNLSFIAKEEKDLKKSISYLNSARDKFKDNNRIIDYYLASTYFDLKDRVKANEIVQKYSNDPLFFKIYFSLNYSNLEYEAKKSFLWRLFYRTDYNPEVAQFLSWTLLLYSDINDLDLFFRIYDLGENQDWYNFYKFYYFFIKKNFDGAKETVLKSKNSVYSYGVYYNLGVLNSYERNFNKAEGYFNMSISLMPFTTYDKDRMTKEEKENMSKIYLKQGINYLYLRKYDKGEDAIHTSYFFYENSDNKLYKSMVDVFKTRD